MNEFTFDQLKIGHTETFRRQISREDILIFSSLSGDTNPLHLDEDYARTTDFKKCVAFGMLGSTMHSTLSGVYLPGKYSLLLKEESNFINPIYAGDTLTVTAKLTEKKEFGKLIFIDTQISNHDNKKVIRGKLIVKLLK